MKDQRFIMSARCPLLLPFFLFVGGTLFAQSYASDLKNEDLNALDQRLKTLGTTYRAEPLLAAYLAFGQNEEFVAGLLKKGSNPNQKTSSTLSPLSLAIVRNLGPGLVSLLLQAGASLEPRVVGYSGTIIDVALDKQEWENAAQLVKANQRSLPKARLVPVDRFKDYLPVLLDDLVQVRNLLRFGNLDNTLVWNLALAGNSRKVLKYLLEFQIAPHLNDPGNPRENGVGLDLLASHLDLLAYLLSDGLSRDDVDFDQLYLRLFARRSLDSVVALRALDPVDRPTLRIPALNAGSDFFKATTKLAELPPSEFTNLYRLAFVKKDAGLIGSLISADPQRVRPELYSEGMDSGFDLFKALTRDMVDLKDPTLYRSGNQDNGRENLTAVLWRSGPGNRTLMERIFEKTDFATVLSLVQLLNPPQELLVGKEFSAAYQQWLNRGNKDILAFGFGSSGGQASLLGTDITVVVPAETNVTTLVAEFRLSGGEARVGPAVQVSGKTANDFSSPVVYEVTAQDGSKKAYLVTVTVVPLEPKVDVPAP